MLILVKSKQINFGGIDGSKRKTYFTHKVPRTHYIVGHEEKRVHAVIEENADAPAILDRNTVCDRTLYTSDSTAGLLIGEPGKKLEDSKQAKRHRLVDILQYPLFLINFRGLSLPDESA